MSALIDRVRGAGRRRARRAAPRPTRTPSCAPAATRWPSEVAELTWDLGGLTYEMAIRDHFRLDVLIRRAADAAGGATPSWARSSACSPPPTRASAATAAPAARPTAAAPSTAGSAASR